MKVAKSADAIRTALLSYAEVDVLYVEVRHQSGPLRYFAGKLAAREINIASGHGDWPLGLALLQSLTGEALQPLTREAAAAA